VEAGGVEVNEDAAVLESSNDADRHAERGCDLKWVCPLGVCGDRRDAWTPAVGTQTLGVHFVKPVGTLVVRTWSGPWCSQPLKRLRRARAGAAAFFAEVCRRASRARRSLAPSRRVS